MRSFVGKVALSWPARIRAKDKMKMRRESCDQT
jgi:hypothetical protein